MLELILLMKEISGRPQIPAQVLQPVPIFPAQQAAPVPPGAQDLWDASRNGMDYFPAPETETES